MAQVADTTIMGRIREEIDVDGRKCWALFDSGARNSYITQDAASGLPARPLPQPRETLLGGKSHSIEQTCIVIAEIEGHPVDFQAWVIDEIGRDEDGRTIDVLFGALAMQLWGIKLDVPNEKLDFSHYTREFIEY